MNEIHYENKIFTINLIFYIEKCTEIVYYVNCDIDESQAQPLRTAKNSV